MTDDNRRKRNTDGSTLMDLAAYVVAVMVTWTGGAMVLAGSITGAFSAGADVAWVSLLWAMLSLHLIRGSVLRHR